MRHMTLTVTRHKKDNLSNQLSLPHQDDCKIIKDIPKQRPTQNPDKQKGGTLHKTINKKKYKTTAFEQTAV